MGTVGHFDHQIPVIVRKHIAADPCALGLPIQPHTQTAMMDVIVVDLGIHRQTAAAYLDQLVDEGLLSKEKVGRENIYKNVKLLALFENDSEVTV